MSKEAKETSEVTAKRERNKAQKLLKRWADNETQVELLVADATLRVRGTIRQFDEEFQFMFLSASREISSLIFLRIWDDIKTQPDNPLGATVRLRSRHRESITLTEETAATRPEEIAAVVDQFRLWSKLKLTLVVYFEFPLGGTYSRCEVEEHSQETFALINTRSGQIHTLAINDCGIAKITREGDHTTVTLGAKTGHFLATVSDTNTSVEETLEHFAATSRLIH